MHRVEPLPDPDQILEIRTVAWPASTFAVRDIGRARHRAEGERVAADGQASRRVAGMQRELSRGQPDLRLDQFAGKTHPLRIGIDLRAGTLEDLARTGMEEVHADF